MAGPLHGSHALVTGGGSGIGLAVAEELLRLGCDLTLVGRSRERLDHAIATLGGAGRVHAEAADISDPEAVEAAFAGARAALGAPEILVASAGGAETAPFSRTDLALWQRMLAVNLTGTYLCVRAALPAMIASGRGRVVAVSSTAGLAGFRYATAYSAAKHGVVGLVRSLALETAATGVTVNAVCPAYTDTPMLRASAAEVARATGRTAEEILESLARENLRGRLVTPAEVATAVGGLCLPGQAAVNGHAIVIHGGQAA